MKYSNSNFRIEDVIFQGNIEDDCLFVDWCVLYECNYKCSYCFGQNTLENAVFTPIEKMKHAVDQLFSIEKKRYCFTITGGEVTYYPYLFDLIDYIFSFNKNVSVYIITNGSRSVLFFDSLFNKYYNLDLTITISIHIEYAKIEHIKDIIVTANKYNKRIRLSLMLHTNMHKEVQIFFESLMILRNEYEFDMNLAELRSGDFFDKVDPRYDEKYIKWIDDTVDMINDKKFIKDKLKIVPWGPKPYFNLNNGETNIRLDHYKAMRNLQKRFTNFYCCGGINAIRINTDGSYAGGVCKDFPVIGNIYEDKINYEKLFNFTKCTLYECGCRANDCIPKFKKLEDAIVYTDHIKINYLLQAFLYTDKKLDNYILKNNIFTKELIDSIAWWIPIRKWRDNFRSRFAIADQTRPDQTRPDQTRPDLINTCNDYICFYHNSKYKKIQPMLQLQIAA
ncbi:hypothetical protein R4J00_07165 [Brachyspira intermedia]|uniref:radical SAM protein n=1 Tax=Brachyspira intermedia TaxID=84377 RepID=UPI00300491CA